MRATTDLSLGFTLPREDEQLPQPVAEVIAAIETDIIRGRILPRSRLIEDHLMEDYNVKRHVVRAALTELQRLGVVVKPRHRGAELRRFDREQLAHLYSLRETLHRAAVRDIAYPVSPDDLRNVEEHFAWHAEAADGADLVAIHRTNMAFHSALFGLCGNLFLVDAIRRHDWLSFPVRAYGVADAAALRQARIEHAQMLDALRQEDGVELERLTVLHMARAREIYTQKFLDAER